MVEIRLADDKDAYREGVERVIETTAAEFVPYEGYGAPDRDDGVDPAFFANYRYPEEEMVVAIDGRGDDEDVVGFFCFDVDTDRDDIPVDDPFTYLSLAMVEPAYRGQGIGTRLYQHTLAHLAERGPDRVACGTWSGNERQHHLLEKMGFEEVARREGHRVNGDDSVYYVCHL